MHNGWLGVGGGEQAQLSIREGSFQAGGSSQPALPSCNHSAPAHPIHPTPSSCPTHPPTPP